MSDPAAQSFAIFVNSNQAVVKSTAKSQCSIPFVANLAMHDPQKMFKIALSMVKYTNSVYNITTDRNTLEIAVEYGPGRGFTTQNDEAGRFHRWQTWGVRIPPGAYDIVELSNLLSEGRYLYNPEAQPSAYANRVGFEIPQQPFQYANEAATLVPVAPGNGGASTTFQNIFNGFGAVPIDASDPVLTKGAISIDNNSKVVFQSPDLGHLIQYGTDITTPCTNKLNLGDVANENTLDRSMVYKGVYLLFNAITAPLLKVLGFFNIDSVPAPLISGYINNQNNFQVAQGYGLQFVASTVYRPYPVYSLETGLAAVPQQPFDPTQDRYAKDNITKYALTTFNLSEGVDQFIPTLPNSVTFTGHFDGNTAGIPLLVGQPSAFLNALYAANSTNTNYQSAEITPGFTLSGANILPPNPIVLSVVNTPMAYTYPRIICSRDVLDAANYRWNYDAANLPNSLLPTEIGIWGSVFNFLAPPNNNLPPGGIQVGMAVTFLGDGLGNDNLYLSNAGAPNALTTNLYNKIIQFGEWREVQSGPTGGPTDRSDWIYCMRLTDNPQATVAAALPARLITDFSAGVSVLGVIDPTQWLAAEAGGPNPTDYMGYYNLRFQFNRVTVNTPQLVASVDPTIVYTPMLASNVGLNDLNSALIPKNLTNLEGLDEIHIHCAQLRTKHLASTSFQPLAPSDVIGVVPVDMPFGSKGTWQPPVPLESFLSNTNIVQLDFRLTDSSDRLLDFNGLDWSMVFNCQEVELPTAAQLQGTINTVFQDQLATMEGTAYGQVRAMRKRGGKSIIPHEFYDENTQKKSNSYSRDY